MIKTILTMIVACIVFFPCLLIFNESGNFLPNLGGFLYCAILYIALRTKVGKTALYWLENANKNIEYWLFK